MSANKRQKLRRQAFEKQNCLCFYCQFLMWEKNQEQFAIDHGIPVRLTKHLKCTAEHLVAQQDKGRDTAENIVAACLWCNRLRHKGRQHKAPDPTTYKSIVRRLVQLGKWHPVAASLGIASAVDGGARSQATRASQHG
jgi:5-methylcytosine-specific restriction endonuclease McrA